MVQQEEHRRRERLSYSIYPEPIRDDDDMGPQPIFFTAGVCSIPHTFSPPHVPNSNPMEIQTKKNKKNTRLWLTVDKLDIFTLSLLFFSSSPAGLYCASTNTLLLTGWKEQQHSKGEKKIKSIMLYGTCVYSCTHIYCRLDSKLPWHGRTIAHPCMRDLFGCLKEQIEFKMRERECVPARNTRT